MLAHPMPSRLSSGKQAKHPYLTSTHISQAQRMIPGEMPSNSPYPTNVAASPFTPCFPHENGKLSIHPGMMYTNAMSTVSCILSPSIPSVPSTPTTPVNPDMLSFMSASTFHSSHPAPVTITNSPVTIASGESSAMVPTSFMHNPQYLQTLPHNHSGSSPHPTMGALDNSSSESSGQPVVFNHSGLVHVSYSGSLVSSQMHTGPSGHSSDQTFVPYQHVDHRMDNLMHYPPGSFNLPCELQPPVVTPSLSFSSDYSGFSTRDYDNSATDYQVAPNVVTSNLVSNFQTVPHGYPLPGSVEPVRNNAPGPDRPRRRRTNPRGRQGGKREKSKGNPINRDPKEKKFVCEFEGCDIRFNRAEHVSRHYKSVHLKSRPYTCDEPGCGKTFSRTDNLTQHRRTHDKSRNKAKEREYQHAFVKTVVGDDSATKRVHMDSNPGGTYIHFKSENL
ncbi:hypothetical protein IWQ61_000731 [Dispira simplex]|nr:hypothetical protein IWQ61_000731 [Dispira simplex]